MSKKKASKKVENVVLLEEMDFEVKDESNEYTVIWIDEEELQISHCSTQEDLQDTLEMLKENYELEEEGGEEFTLNSRVIVVRGYVEPLKIYSYRKFDVEE